MILANNVALKAVARPTAVRGLAPLRPSGVVARRPVVVKSAETEDPSAALQKKTEEVVKYVKEQWEATEDAEKPAAVAIIIGVVIAQIAIGATMDSIDHIPLVKQFLEFVGLAVTATYAYRYFTDPAEREQVKSTVDSFLASVTGKRY